MHPSLIVLESVVSPTACATTGASEWPTFESGLDEANYRAVAAAWFKRVELSLDMQIQGFRLPATMWDLGSRIYYALTCDLVGWLCLCIGFICKQAGSLASLQPHSQGCMLALNLCLSLCAHNAWLINSVKPANCDQAQIGSKHKVSLSG